MFRELSRMMLDVASRGGFRADGSYLVDSLKTIREVDPHERDEGEQHALCAYTCATAVNVSFPPVRFIASDNLVDRLEATDFPEMTVADLRLPFDGFVVQVPKKYLKPGDLQAHYFIVAKLEDGLTMVECAPSGTGGIHIRASLIHSEAYMFTAEDKGYNVPSLDFFARFLLYVSSDAAEHSVSNKTARGCGPGAIVLPPIRAKHRNKRGGISHKEVTKRTVRFGRSVKPFVAHANTLVRGHFKRQAYGKGRKLRKVIWVEPYLRYKDESFPVLGKDVTE